MTTPTSSSSPIIALPDVPGIRGPLEKYPATGRILCELAQEVLINQATETFTKAERETVASYVSFLNHCQFCLASHVAVADELWNVPGYTKCLWLDHMDKCVVEEGKLNVSRVESMESKRLCILMELAKCIQSLKYESIGDLAEQAKQLGSTEKDIHDAVLISSSFNLFNRYVNGLNTVCPSASDPYFREAAKRLTTIGYLMPPQEKKE